MSESSSTSKSSSQAEGVVHGARVGVVESDKRNKTRRVVVRFQQRHPKYGKYIQGKTVLQVHDENNESHLGDRVEVAPCRPISRTKTWTLLRIIERAPGGS
jgi:small subunit ribosomal protein S17